jgi:hypothetical protein
MILSSGGKKPKIHSTAYVAPNATVGGDVSVEAGCAILYGAVVVAEGTPVTIGKDCVVMENAVVKSTPKFPVKIGDECFIGPHATVVGTTLANGTRLPANEVRLPAGDPFGSTKSYAEALRAAHAKETTLAAHENVAPGGTRRDDTLQAPVEAETVVDVMMLELQEMEAIRRESQAKKKK